MIYYNVTSRLDRNIEAEWINWMQEKHIPEMLNTKYFTEVKLLKIDFDDQEDNPTYATQYLLASETLLKSYIKNKADILKNKIIEKFGERVLSFNTKLEVISEHK